MKHTGLDLTITLDSEANKVKIMFLSQYALDFTSRHKKSRWNLLYMLWTESLFYYLRWIEIQCLELNSYLGKI